MKQPRLVTVPAGDGIGWVLPSYELLPLHSRPATPASLAELELRYVTGRHDLGDGAVDAVAGFVALVLAGLEPGES
jgi:hypothetical protein